MEENKIIFNNLTKKETIFFTEKKMIPLGFRHPEVTKK